MVDIRDHGGNYKGGGYRPNTYIPTWKLSPMVQDIGGFERRSAAEYNDYRPVVHYDVVTNRIYTGSGKVEMMTKAGVYAGRYAMGNYLIYDIKAINNAIFVSTSSGVIKIDKELVDSTMIGISPVKGMVYWKDEKVYVYETSNKRVFILDAKTEVPKDLRWSFISLTGTITGVSSFTRDDNYFYLGNQDGKIYVYTLQGTLIKTISVTGTSIGQMYIRNGYIFTTSQRTLYKINADTGASVWSTMVAATGGILSGELAFEDNYIYAPSSNNTGNMFIVKEPTGETVFKGNVLKMKYASTESQNLHGIHIVNGEAFMTHMITSDTYGLYYNLVLWPTKLKLMR